MSARASQSKQPSGVSIVASVSLKTETGSKELLPLVLHIVKSQKWKRPTQVDYEDIVGIGLAGLCEATVKFDPRRNCKFSTYAFGKIKNSIRDALRRARVYESRFAAANPVPDFQVCDELEKDLSHKQLFQMVLSMVYQLDTLEQVLLFRHHLQGVSVEELAHEISRHPRWVSGKIHKALTLVRDTIFHYGGKGQKPWLG